MERKVLIKINKGKLLRKLRFSEHHDGKKKKIKIITNLYCISRNAD